MLLQRILGEAIGVVGLGHEKCNEAQCNDNSKVSLNFLNNQIVCTRFRFGKRTPQLISLIR